MFLLELSLKILIFTAFIIFLFKSCKNRMFIEAVVIAACYPVVASMIGQETAKTLVTLCLYGLIVVLALGAKHYKNKLKARKVNAFSFGISVGILLVFFNINALLSPAIGYNYFNNKAFVLLVEIVAPCFLITWLYAVNLFNPKWLLRFFETISLLVSVLMIVNAYKIGVNVIANSAFFPRISLGEANVIWIGRFISLGLIIVILSGEKFIKKAPKVVLLTLAMVLTGSKAVLLFPVVAVFLYMTMFNKQHSINFKVKILSVISVVIIAGFFTLSHLNPLAMERRFSFDSGTIDLRSQSIASVFSSYIDSENLFFGNGFATSGYPLVGDYDITAYPHNIVIELLYEAGVASLFFYYLPLFISLFAFLRAKNAHYAGGGVETLPPLIIMNILYAQTSGSMAGNTFVFVLSGYLFLLLCASSKNSPVSMATKDAN